MTYTATFNENYLSHHGVKGMKWGVRRKKLKQYKSLYKKGNDALINMGMFNAAKATRIAARKAEIGSDDFQREYVKQFRKLTVDSMKNNKYYKEAEALVEEYGLEKYKIVKENRQVFNDYVSSYGN